MKENNNGIVVDVNQQHTMVFSGTFEEIKTYLDENSELTKEGKSNENLVLICDETGTGVIAITVWEFLFVVYNK